MATFRDYQRTYESMRRQLEAEYQTLSLQEKSRRVLGRANPLLSASARVSADMARLGLSRQAVEQGLNRQAAQFEGIAHHTLVYVPLRRVALPDARWIFLDFSGQAGGWRYRRAEAVDTFRAAIAGKPAEASCRFLSGGIVSSDLLDRLLFEEFTRPGAAFRVTAKQIRCHFHLWVAQTPNAIPNGDCIHIV